jgi:hypothetical protein
MTNTTDSATSAPLGANHHVSASAPTGADGSTRPQASASSQASAQPVTTAPTRTLSIISIVLGGASVIFGYIFIVPIAAIVLGFLGLNREPAGRTLAIWGIVLGFVMSLGWVFVGLAGLAIFAPLHFLGGF